MSVAAALFIGRKTIQYPAVPRRLWELLTWLQPEAHLDELQIDYDGFRYHISGFVHPVSDKLWNELMKEAFGTSNMFCLGNHLYVASKVETEDTSDDDEAPPPLEEVRLCELSKDDDLDGPPPLVNFDPKDPTKEIREAVANVYTEEAEAKIYQQTHVPSGWTSIRTWNCEPTHVGITPFLLEDAAQEMAIEALISLYKSGGTLDKKNIRCRIANPLEAKDAKDDLDLLIAHALGDEPDRLGLLTDVIGSDAPLERVSDLTTEQQRATRALRVLYKDPHLDRAKMREMVVKGAPYGASPVGFLMQVALRDEDDRTRLLCDMILDD